MVDVNRALYWVLVAGMLGSTILFIVGLVSYAAPSYSQYSVKILTAGAVILLATPVTRTLVGTILFAVNGERRASRVAAVVFIILMLSILFGFVLHFQV